VFGQTMSPEFWRWKYGEGRGQAVIARRQGQVVAHYGGITRSILYFGQSRTALQICDVMVDPAERGVLTRRGAFFLTAASFAELNPSALGFGFPNKRAMQLAQQLGLYEEVGTLTEIHWRPAQESARAWTRIRPLDHQHGCVFDKLWRRMRYDLNEAIAGVRDHTYMKHRYLAHPVKRYDVLLASDFFGARALGIVVLSHDNTSCELLDIVGPLKNIQRLIRAARTIAHRWGVVDLFCWITSAHARLFLGAEAEQRDPQVSIPISSWNEGPPAEQVRGRWWLMGGDTDFH
jgi:hypothetical protein